ncbi:MAG: molybdopterin-dependent oxidoreductase [Candidatus Kapabacteria bacterium]|nr:molybdopterin-dependent oxidoreductase [Candidatus Kapabacteria bacterium]
MRIVVFVLMFSCATALSAQQDSLARFVSENITVSGKVSKPLMLTLADLSGFTMHTARNIPIISYSGDRKEPIRSCKGVLLRDVLDKAGIIFEEKRDFNRLVIKATATDGFQTLWSWHELYNSDAGNYVFIVIEKDDKPLSTKEGNFMLISTKDLKTGPRHVRWLKSIEVVKL